MITQNLDNGFVKFAMKKQAVEAVPDTTKYVLRGAGIGTALGGLAHIIRSGDYQQAKDDIDYNPYMTDFQRMSALKDLKKPSLIGDLATGAALGGLSGYGIKKFKE